MRAGSESISNGGSVAMPSRRGRIVHGLRLLVVYAAIGAVINLVVVGLLVWRVEPFRPWSNSVRDMGFMTEPISYVRFERAFGTSRAVVTRDGTLWGNFPRVRDDFELPTSIASNVRQRFDQHADLFALVEDRRGFPLLCMYGVIALHKGNTLRPHQSVLIGGQPSANWNEITWPSFGDLQPSKIIPLQPIWWPFLINSLIYGGLTLGVVRTIAFARSRWRARRGHCRRCGYSLRGIDSTACPECGARTPLGAPD